MKIIIDTYRLLRQMGLFKAFSTYDIVKMKSHQRCSVLKQLHRLEKAGFLEKKTGKDNEFYWKVKEIPVKPEGPKPWTESKSLIQLEEERNANKY